MKRSERGSDSHKYADLLKFAAFYKQMQPNVRTLNLLKMMGFKIAELQRRFGDALPHPRPHLLIWNPTLQWGLCLCGKWVHFGDEATAIQQQKIHARLEARQLQTDPPSRLHPPVWPHQSWRRVGEPHSIKTAIVAVARTRIQDGKTGVK